MYGCNPGAVAVAAPAQEGVAWLQAYWRNEPSSRLAQARTQLVEALQLAERGGQEKIVAHT